MEINVQQDSLGRASSGNLRTKELMITFVALPCRYAPKYVKEYVDETIGSGELHLAEFWVDMRWDRLAHLWSKMRLCWQQLQLQ